MDGATLLRLSAAETEIAMVSIVNQMRNVNLWILIVLLMETLRILTYAQLTTNVVAELLPECVVNKVKIRQNSSHFLFQNELLKKQMTSMT